MALHKYTSMLKISSHVAELKTDHHVWYSVSQILVQNVAAAKVQLNGNHRCCAAVLIEQPVVSNIQ